MKLNKRKTLVNTSISALVYIMLTQGAIPVATIAVEREVKDAVALSSVFSGTLFGSSRAIRINPSSLGSIPFIGLKARGSVLDSNGVHEGILTFEPSSLESPNKACRIRVSQENGDYYADSRYVSDVVVLAGVSPGELPDSAQESSGIVFAESEGSLKVFVGRVSRDVQNSLVSVTMSRFWDYKKGDTLEGTIADQKIKGKYAGKARRRGIGSLMFTIKSGNALFEADVNALSITSINGNTVWSMNAEQRKHSDERTREIMRAQELVSEVRSCSRSFNPARAMTNTSKLAQAHRLASVRHR